jgi:hypothetical protein
MVTISSDQKNRWDKLVGDMMSPPEDGEMSANMYAKQYGYSKQAASTKLYEMYESKKVTRRKTRDVRGRIVWFYKIVE